MKKLRIICALTAAIYLFSCQKEDPCPAEFRLADDIYLLEEIKEFIPYGSMEVLRFIGPDGESILFEKVSESLKLIPKIMNVRCYEDGDETSAGIYYRETAEYLYVSNELDSINVRYTPPVVDIQRDGVKKVNMDDIWGFYRMWVQVSLAGCREQNRIREFPLYFRGETVMPRYSVSFTEFTRHGITYESQRVYPVLQDNFKFGLTSGLIGFSMCGKDYIRAIE
jgi:hypothetical protein